MTNKMLSIEETLEAMGGEISRRSLYKWWEDGRGPRRIKLPNGQIRVRVDWLEDWLLGLEDDGLAA
jgi:predicted DNA-binding transcriptional regulator AlpA